MAAPANDNLADATVVTLTDGEYVSAGVLNAEATLQSFEGVGQPFPSMGWSCWWTWTPDEDVTVQVDTMQSTGAPDVDTRLWIFSGTDETDMVQVATNDDGGHVEPNLDYPALITPFAATAGTHYLVRVDGYSNDMTYVLHIGTLGSTSPSPTAILGGRTREGSGVDLSTYPVVALPASLRVTSHRIIAEQLPTPTLIEGVPQW